MTNRHILTEDEIQTLLHAFDNRQTPDVKSVSPAAGASTSPTGTDRLSLADSQQALNTIQTELRQLRSMMFSSLGAHSSPLKAKIIERLNSQGFHAITCEKILAGLALSPDEKIAWQQIIISLESQLTVSQDNILDHNGVIAFVGPTGSGKTTLIAKIATKFIQRHSPQEIGLITTDYYSVNGRDQLGIYGNILDIPVHRVNSSTDLKQALDNLQPKRLILIDTPGLSQRDPDFKEKMSLISHSPRALKTILTLSATTHELILSEIIQVFNQIQLDGLTITKTDEAPYIGHLLSACIDHQLPIVALSDGQHIPNNFMVASIDKILSLAIKRWPASQVSVPQASESLNNLKSSEVLPC